MLRGKQFDECEMIYMDLLRETEVMTLSSAPGIKVRFEGVQ
jgi:hypothetical protein